MSAPPNSSLPARAVRKLHWTRRAIAAAGGLRAWFLYLPGPGPRCMSWLRRRWVLFRNPHAHIEFRGPVYLGPGFSLDLRPGATFIVGPGVEFRRGFRAEIGSGARVEIGAGCYLTYDVIIACSSSIEIGERCGVAQCAFIVDGSHRYRDLETPFLDQGYNLRPLRIEDDVQIHSKCTILNNIATRSIIGANAVVTRAIPPYCVATGVPAKVIEYFGPAGQEPPGLDDRSARAESTG